jgi:hypothetical protein
MGLGGSATAQSKNNLGKKDRALGDGGTAHMRKSTAENGSRT